jgi:hypothetical protein
MLVEDESLSVLFGQTFGVELNGMIVKSRVMIGGEIRTNCEFIINIKVLREQRRKKLTN